MAAKAFYGFLNALKDKRLVFPMRFSSLLFTCSIFIAVQHFWGGGRDETLERVVLRCCCCPSSGLPIPEQGKTALGCSSTSHSTDDRQWAVEIALRFSPLTNDTPIRQLRIVNFRLPIR